MNNVVSACVYWYFTVFSPQILGVKDTAEGLFEDFADFLDEHFREKLADMIVYIIQLMVDLLANGLAADSTEGGVYTAVKRLMLYHPENYMQGNTWKMIVDISEKTIVPIATTMIAIIAVYDLYQMVVIGNGMHDFDSSFFIRWVIKTNIAIMLTSNAFSITAWIFSFGSDLAFNTVSGSGSWLNTLLTDIDTSDTLKDALMQYHVGRLVVTLLLSIITLVAIFLMFAVIIIGLMGRLIEMFMYMSISPISLATLLNNETKGIGDSWVRGALGLSFQVFFIIIALTIFGSIFQTTMDKIAAGTHIIWDMVLLCGYSITLIVTILRSGQISKGMFGAH